MAEGFLEFFSANKEVLEMIDLLAADFTRMLKSIPFIGCVLFCIDFPIVLMFRMKGSSEVYTFDSAINILFLLMGLIMAVFVSLFVGMEYDDHTMRNKVLVGHSRIKIYLSDYIVCLTGGFILQAVFTLVVFIGTIIAPLLGIFVSMSVPIDQLIECQLIGLYITSAYVGIFVFFCLIIPNQAYSTVVCVALAALIFALGYTVSYSVAPSTEIYYEMKFVPQSIINSMRGMGIEDERKRALYKFIDDVLPACHAYNIKSGYITGRPLVNVLSDTIISLGFTVFGLLFFRKKDFV